MKTLAIIPARGGSKRIPRKNIRDFLGKPILAYSIEAALSCGLFDEVMVSTEDHEIAEVAKSYGANIPFLRSEKTADDYTPLADIMFEVFREYDQRGIKFNNFCCILATAPFVSSKALIEAFDILSNSVCDCVFSALQFSYPIQRALAYNKEGYLKMIIPENRIKRSQDLPNTFHDAGQFYFANVEAFKKGGYFLAGRTKGIILHPNHAHDIDTEEDWEIAEMKYKLNLLKKKK